MPDGIVGVITKYDKKMWRDKTNHREKLNSKVEPGITVFITKDPSFHEKFAGKMTKLPDPWLANTRRLLSNAGWQKEIYPNYTLAGNFGTPSWLANPVIHGFSWLAKNSNNSLAGSEERVNFSQES